MTLFPWFGDGESKSPTMERISEVNELPSSLNLAFLESLYKVYLRDSASLSREWVRYFDGLSQRDDSHIESGFPLSPVPENLSAPPSTNGTVSIGVATLQDRVNELVRNHRARGHLVARIDPLGLARPQPSEITPESYGFTQADLRARVACETAYPRELLTLQEVLERLRHTYCGSIGAQFMHIDDLAVRKWLQERMERTQNQLELKREERLRILAKLTDATVFEEFIRKKFPGAKSFSLEGAESLISLLDLLIERAGEQGIEQMVLGMAHRGRLNVLANIMGKSMREIFREFETKDLEPCAGRGDVRYHLGHSNTYTTARGHEVYLALNFNPSHVEFVNPVALGQMRAQQDRLGDRERTRGMVLLIHGDASFAGEGIVQETLNLSRLDGYTVGGTLHVIVNNQIGFTTNPGEGRSSIYATDVAKMLQIPIFHVNGEDLDAVAQVVRLAMDFRREFKRDVVIDLYCYRRRGHNEADEPSFTQPLMYRAIEQCVPVRENYLERLLKLGYVAREEADEIARVRRAVRQW